MLCAAFGLKLLGFFSPMRLVAPAVSVALKFMHALFHRYETAVYGTFMSGRACCFIHVVHVLNLRYQFL